MYISAIRLNTICNLNKYIFEILTNTIGNFIGLQAKKLSDQQAAAEEQNATLQFVQIHCQIWTKTFVQFEQIHFEIWTNTIRTNTFSNLDKYIFAI